MFCPPPLGKIVRPYLGASVPARHHGLTRLRQLSLLLLQFHVQKPRAQYFQSLRLVLELRALVLALNHDPRGNVADPNRRVGRVDALSARAPRGPRDSRPWGRGARGAGGASAARPPAAPAPPPARRSRPWPRPGARGPSRS